MKKITIIILSFYYFLGNIFLPDGNFMYLIQIHDIYSQFEAINGKTDFFSFLDENFLEFEDRNSLNDEDEPYEKEEKPIPFKTITYSVTNPAFLLILNDLQAKPKLFIIVKKSIYLIKKYTSISSSIFHPPKFVALYNYVFKV